MKEATRILSFYILLFLTFINSLNAQNVTGIWRWTTKGTNKDLQTEYLVELHLKQEGNKVSGTQTLFLSEYDDVVIWLEGEINRKGNLVLSAKNDIHNQTPDSILIANKFTYKLFLKSNKPDNMTGFMYPKEDKKIRKVHYKLNEEIYENIFVKPHFAQFKRLSNELNSEFDDLKKIQETKPETFTNIIIPEQPRKITTQIQHQLEIDADSLFIEIYDNGEIDNDIVTILVNNFVVAEHQRLTLKPIELSINKKIWGDSISIILRAETLGHIPPNTALMIIKAGDKRYDIKLSGTLEKQAGVVIRKKTKLL